MAAIKRNSRKERKKNNTRSMFLCFFGGCFGISNKVSADHADGKLIKHGRKGKTVAINDQDFPTKTTSSEIISSREIHVVDAEEESTQIPAAAPVQEEIEYNKDKKAKNSKESSQETWSKPSKLSHSISLPLPPQNGMNLKGKKGKEKKELIKAGEFDSIIILIILSAMLIWGKVCAILCTAAWFYMTPRIRPNIDEDDYGKNIYVQYLDSKEYKKKVVLQGLLERNPHRL